MTKKPFVSICTPTFNRRPFIPALIQCFLRQTYPRDKMEWIIVDDGTDPVGDLFDSVSNGNNNSNSSSNVNIKYFRVEEKMRLGSKRNFMHSKCSGDIIVYMDDDDYYPRERVEHAVRVLQQQPKYMIVGSSEMYIYFDSIGKVCRCGPYGKYHSTAATFAFRKELLQQTSFSEQDNMSEERTFLKNYLIPLYQLDPKKSIVVFSHKHNSLNKEKLLENPEQTKTVITDLCLDSFFPNEEDDDLKMFYSKYMNEALTGYEPGRPEQKPEVLEQIRTQEESRAKRLEENQKILDVKKRIEDAYNRYNRDGNGDGNDGRVAALEKQLTDKNILIGELMKRIKDLQSELAKYKSG